MSAPVSVRFEKCWTKNEDCKKIFRRAWSHTAVGIPMFYVTEKIKAVRVALLMWRQKTFNSNLTAIDEVCNRLGFILTHPRKRYFEATLVGFIVEGQ